MWEGGREGAEGREGERGGPGGRGEGRVCDSARLEVSHTDSLQLVPGTHPIRTRARPLSRKPSHAGILLGCSHGRP